jgi:queuine tRNA-ribosyltransferase
MFDYHIGATNGGARAGTLLLPHGTVTTPTFMPVGTQGSVRALSPADLRQCQTQIVLGNTYHLHLRPGEDVVATLGGLHRFMAWDRPILTDSGGFQVFSLEGLRRVDDDGVTFRSHIDGSEHYLTPETAVEIQWRLGSDVAMAFDHVVPGTADRPTATDALHRSMQWLRRCRVRHDSLVAERPHTQTLWPILQGGTYPELRRDAARKTCELEDWTGIAIGGLAVGETKGEMWSVLESLEPSLPPQVPRYLMGVGFPDDMLRAISRGVDLFDCVAPTRNGRNGSAFTPDGPLNIRNAIHRTVDAPLDETCDCEACRVFSRGYLRHLFAAEELLGLRLMSLHNVRFLVRLAESARAAIIAGTFERWSDEWLRRYKQRGST